MNEPNSIRSLRALGIGLVLGGLALWSGGCAVEERGPYPAGPYAGPYYDYYYYPDVDVYFYPEGGIYYWRREGRWESGRRLPEGFAIHEEHREQLHLRSREPWTEHHEARPEERQEQRGEHHEEMEHHGD